MKNKDWEIPFQKPDAAQELIRAGYNPLLAIILTQRNITSREEADKILKGGEGCLHDPLLIKNMAPAAERIRKAIRNREKTAVYGDYDVDGITATCLVTDYLRSKGLDCISYIPDRTEEGYGVNCSAIDTLKSKNVTLIITVDCGITAVAETEYAASLGIDMIITDHHECKDENIPKAIAVVDCKQPDDTYPNPYLAGVGMALKLVCACEGESRSMIDRYVDLVAIGTVADVVPLVDENRHLVRLGLKKLGNPTRPGVAAMFRETLNDPHKVTASTIGYSIAPRLNAAGRLGCTETAIRLLLCEDEQEAAQIAAELCELNRQRQSIEMEIWDEANSMLSGKRPTEPIVLASDRWHQGVIGIAASRLAEQYSLPSIMICINGDIGKGSCRSCGDFNLFEALSACSEHLIGFGGHALAAGLTIKADKLDGFRRAFSDYYLKNRPNLQPDIKCDMLINDPTLLSVENVHSLELMEPYGNMNPKPVMCMYGINLEAMSTVGGGKHLRMRVRMGNTRFECIFFSHSAKDLGIKEGDMIDIAFIPQINEFRGHESVQFVIYAARPHNSKELCDEILNGGVDTLYAASRFAPDRNAFVRIWRGMNGLFRVGSNTKSVMASRPDGMLPETYCLCLRIFMEAGLLENRSGKVFGAGCAVVNGKANLEETVCASTLRTFRKEIGL